MTTTNPKEISISRAFRPFLRQLNAFNCENFQYNNTKWRSILRNVFYAFASTMMIFLLAAISVLAFWFLIEINANLKRFFVSLPLVISTTQMEITLIVLLMKNRVINNTIDRLQSLVNQRELFIALLSNPWSMGH